MGEGLWKTSLKYFRTTSNRVERCCFKQSFKQGSNKTSVEMFQKNHSLKYLKVTIAANAVAQLQQFGLSRNKNTKEAPGSLLTVILLF